MKTPPISLEEIFRTQINELYATEKKYLKSFEALSAASETEELVSALSEEKSWQDSHVSRLAMILEFLKLKATRQSSTLSEELLGQINEVSGYKKQKNIFKDIQILQTLKTIYGVKIATYSSLKLIAENIDLKQPAELLTQSLEDSRNNLAYLIQIEQNIIYPAARKAV